MDIYMVGVYKQRNKVIGFRMLDPNATDQSKRIMDVEYDKVLAVLRSKGANIVNLKEENGKIKGYNGSLDRYGTVGKTQSLVILRKAIDEKDNMLGYICSDSMGNMRLLSEQQVIGYATKMSLANGKVVTDASGKSYVSAIEGTYQTYTKPSNKQQPVQQQQPAQQQPARTHLNGVDNETIDLVNKLQSYPDYKGSYAEKVVTTIKKLNRSTDKQKACLRKQLGEFEAKHKQQPQAAQKQQAAPTQPKQQEQPKEQTQQVPQQVQWQAPPRKVYDVTSDKMFEAEIMNNQLYIKRFTKEARNTVTDLVIPDTMEFKGKTYQVSGISTGAFAQSVIRYVKTGKYITDIGQSVFKGCVKLEEADLSESNHVHIAMYCFEDCLRLQSVKVGNRVERIHEGAFKGCKALKEIELPDTTDTIARIAFLECSRLESVKCSATSINDSAFRECCKLKQFDFSHTVNIGSHAFRYTAFEKLVLPGNITTIGTKAFSDVFELQEVELGEGIEVLGEYCFAKNPKASRNLETTNRRVVPIKSILTCKSIKEIGTDAFRHADLVKVYTGSVAESHCIGFSVPYVRLDGADLDNSTKVRIKSEIVDTNPLVVLWSALNTPTEGASNPPIELKTTKLVDIPFKQQNFDFFGIPETTEEVQPHAKFIGLVNYLQDVSDLYQDPLSNSILRLQKTYNVKSHTIYDDGCNRAYKVIYELVDTLEEGGFIMIIMNNHLRFVAQLTTATDVNISNCVATDENIPIQKFIHAGDKIGKTSTISGHNGLVEIEGKQVNVGEAFFNRMSEHCIEIVPQRKDSIWYVPAVGLALKLHDKREWEKDNYSQSGKKIARNSEDCLNVLQVMTYDEFVANASTYRKHTIDSNKFFKTINSMSEREVKDRINLLASVEEEKEAQLFHVSKEFIAKLQAENKSLDSATPNDLTIDLVNELSQSYWMIEKDEDWLRVTGKKSLNKTNEYMIDGYKLIEYKSNQVVKFSNPYMNGQKGAYVFTLTKGRNSYGVYASRHSMQQIVTKLVKLTQMKPGTVPIDLMQDAYTIDTCTYDLFYNFYDVLYSKDGWSFKSQVNGYNRLIWNLSADFHIAMYKPTGIFYLTMEAYISNSKDGVTGRRTMPLLPIGNMDRALMIATTTNSKNKDSQLLKELMVLAAVVLFRANGVTSIPSRLFKEDIDVDAYFKARELAIQGVKDINLYKQLVNDRVVYMLGTVHKGVLQREHDSTDIDVDVSDMGLYEQEETYGDINTDDLDIEIDTDAEDDYELYDEGGPYAEPFDDEDDSILYDVDELYDEDDNYSEDEVNLESDSSGISDSDLKELQKQLRAAGHELSLNQIRLMMLQQMR